MNINDTLNPQQPDLFESHRPPIDWKVLPSSVREELLKRLNDLLQSSAARRLIRARKEASHE